MYQYGGQKPQQARLHSGGPTFEDLFSAYYSCRFFLFLILSDIVFLSFFRHYFGWCHPRYAKPRLFIQLATPFSLFYDVAMMKLIYSSEVFVFFLINNMHLCTGPLERDWHGSLGTRFVQKENRVSITVINSKMILSSPIVEKMKNNNNISQLSCSTLLFFL